MWVHSTGPDDIEGGQRADDPMFSWSHSHGSEVTELHLGRRKGTNSVVTGTPSSH
jgi:hypothetical protein